MSDISREIYRYITHPSPSISLINDNFLDSSSKLTRIITYFQTREYEKLITTFFIEYFPSPSICHKTLRFSWKLLRTIIHSLELEKLIINFFMKKSEFVTIDIYRKIYWYTMIYRTPIYRYIESNISIFPIYRHIVAIPSHKVNLLSHCSVL